MADDLMTASELAKYLKVEVRTVYRYLKDADLPAIRMGGRWRFRKEDIDRWLVERAPLHAHRRAQPRILVVDDDETFRSLLDDFFQTKGYLFRGAENGEAALALIKDMTFELLLVDLLMPGMGGIELIRQAKRLRPDIRILVLTAYGDKESAIEALRLGVTDYIEKPIQDLEAFASAVKLALKA